MRLRPRTRSVPVRVLVRTDINWAQMTVAAFGKQTDQDRPLLFIKFAEANGVFDVWDSWSQTDYFAFREALANVSKQNFSSLPGTSVSVGLDQFASWWADPQDEWIVPVDDDDFFKPTLAQRLSRITSKTDVVAWPEVHYVCPAGESGGPAGPPEFRRPGNKVLWTNNWAVRKSFLVRSFAETTARKVLTDHSFATKQIARVLGDEEVAEADPWYAADLTAPAVQWVDEPMSLTVKHPASLYFLGLILQTDDPVAELRRRGFGAAARIPDDLSWMAPWLRQVEALLRQANPSYESGQ